jgi:putative serine protease PepD
MTESSSWSPPPNQPPGGWWQQPASGWPSGPSQPPPGPRGPNTPGGWYALILVALIAAVLGGSISGLIVHEHDNNNSDASVKSVTLGSADHAATGVVRAPGSVAGVASRILPSVVSIEVKLSGGSGDTGSGIVLSKAGYIMTNNHVIAAARSGGGTLSVILPDKTKVSAKIIGRPDTVDDIAIIKVTNVHGLQPATLGNSDDLAVGDPVIAVGSPLGLAGTVTSGIVSALNRPVEAGGAQGIPEDVIDAIQTDAAINPGNSGGPLVNSSGQVVGVNSAIASLSTDSLSGSQSGSIGLGFAIPINEAKRIAQQIITQGYSTHAIIGVQLDSRYQGSGAEVGSPSGGSPVTAGGPAARAGLKGGDVIVAVNGEKVTNADELIVAIRRHVPGQRISLTYIRDGQSRTVSLVLGSQKSV